MAQAPSLSVVSGLEYAYETWTPAMGCPCSSRTWPVDADGSVGHAVFRGGIGAGIGVATGSENRSQHEADAFVDQFHGLPPGSPEEIGVHEDSGWGRAGASADGSKKGHRSATSSAEFDLCGRDGEI